MDWIDWDLMIKGAVVALLMWASYKTGRSSTVWKPLSEDEKNEGRKYL